MSLSSKPVITEKERVLAALRVLVKAGVLETHVAYPTQDKYAAFVPSDRVEGAGMHARLVIVNQARLAEINNE